jgi:hypothetical protein
MHNHEVKNFTWRSGFLASGSVYGLGLSGDFSIRFEFSHEDLRNWLEQYLSEDPREALLLLAEMHAKATLQLIGTPKE